MTRRELAGTTGGLVFALWLVAGNSAAQPAVTMVMSGLDNPRGLAFGPEGAVYVAEAGRGGAGRCGVNAPGETIYVTNNGVVPGNGEVLKIQHP